MVACYLSYKAKYCIWLSQLFCSVLLSGQMALIMILVFIVTQGTTFLKNTNGANRNAGLS